MLTAKDTASWTGLLRCYTAHLLVGQQLGEQLQQLAGRLQLGSLVQHRM